MIIIFSMLRLPSPFGGRAGDGGFKPLNQRSRLNKRSDLTLCLSGEGMRMGALCDLFMPPR